MTRTAARLLSTIATAVAAAGGLGVAHAATFSFEISSPGVSGQVTLTYGAGTDATYPSAFQVTNASGSFSDAAAGISGATITSLVPIARATPEATNLLAPNDFSRYFVSTGLQHGSISYDNLYWPGGSPQTASDYPARGGFLDIYGLLLDIGGGRAVNVWSNGTFGSGPVDYGVAVVTSAAALDYVEGGVTAVAAVPEPSSYAMLGAGLVAVLALRRRAKAG